MTVSPSRSSGSRSPRHHRSTASSPDAWVRRNVRHAASFSPRCRTPPSLSENSADRAGADPIAQPDEFALGAAVSPAGVLPTSRMTSSPISSLIGGRPVRCG